MDENRTVAANMEKIPTPKIFLPKGTLIDSVRVENPSEQEEELSKMAVQGVHEAIRYTIVFFKNQKQAQLLGNS